MEEAGVVWYRGPKLGLSPRAESPIPRTLVPSARADGKALAALRAAADPEAPRGL